MKNNVKKLLSAFLVALMLFTMIPWSASAAEVTPTVEIVSFMRGAQEDLRSSELLEARVTGYDGNVQELTYKWTTTLGTYLYVYNSHNMYHIRNTPGEVEVYNSKKLLPTPDMVGRYYPNSFTGTGYAWAAVHSNSLYEKTQLEGVVTVDVYDKNGNLLCSDSHEGKVIDNKNTGFLNYDIEQDLDNVVIGLFEGEKRDVKDLLGESAIVHIVCVASKVMAGKVVSGEEYIELEKEADGNYYITAEKAGTSTSVNGDALVDLTIQKTNCKFHKNSSGNAETTVFVFKKPTVLDTTTTTLTLGNLDDRCDYFINGVQGVRDGDKVVFTGLEPNTQYMVEVRAEYKDNDDNTRYAYAYVYDTTKPVYQATVNTYLDGVKTDISDIHGEDVTLYLHEKDNNTENIKLEKTATGTYTATVENGIYYPWHIEAGDHEHMAREYKLVIENKNNSLDLHHYSVTYDANGGAFADGETSAKEIYSSMDAVNATENIPVRDGYVFAGWEYGSKVYAPGEEIVAEIVAPIILTAKWEKQVNVTINVTIDHRYDDGKGNKGYDNNSNRDQLVVDFLEMKAGTDALVETGDKLNFTKDGVTDENGNKVAYTISQELQNDEALVTTYKADGVIYAGLPETSAFGVALSKSGYYVEVEKTVDADGDWTINVELTYNPDDFDLEFSVEMADDVPEELYPDAVIVKIACWNNGTWEIISQQRTTDTTVRPGVRVDIDPVTGEGSGSYPVWKFDGGNNPYGYRAVVTGFIYGDSTIIVPTEKDHTKDDNTVIITYTDGNYTATMGDIADGKKFSTSLNGAYYNDATNAQQGTLHGVISVEKYNVTFDAKGGTINGGATYTEKDQYYIPALDAYVPVMEGHTFKGWYADVDCTIPATEGKLLTEDITLYAEWDRVLKGTVIVDGYYKDDGEQFQVDDVDRAKQALVELEEITHDGSYDIAGQFVEINWTEGEHFSIPASYKFTGLDKDKTYRINIYLVNYHEAYQNAITVINDNGDIHDDYNADDFTAVYKEGEFETFVNAFLDFKPETYIQNVVVDTTSVGESFRPKDALVKYYSEEVGVNDDYVLIVQHKADEDGVNVKMSASTGTNDGEYGEEVWKKNYNGNLYNYQAGLVTLDGKAVSEWPVSVVYGDAARWSPLHQASTGDLLAKIVPNRYTITYKWNDGTDYEEVDSRAHIWSYETPINYVPVRVGYNFEGWYDKDGEKVEKISADVAENTTLYAKWDAINACVLTVKHVDKNNIENVLEYEVRPNQTFDSEITAESLIKNFQGYSYDSASSDNITITLDNTKNVITLYYTAISYEYTVNYLEKGTDKKLADSKTDDAAYNTEIVEKAIDIKGYNVEDGILTAVIKEDENVINFYYVAGTFDYTVNYLEEGTNKVLAESKSATATYGTTVTENAVNIEGYALVGTDSQSITIDTENNVINFYYKVNSYNYTVNHYIEADGGYELYKTETDSAKFGTVINSADKKIVVNGYNFDKADVAKITIGADENKNVINLYYSLKSVKYRVEHYLADSEGNYSASPAVKEEFYGKVGAVVEAQPIEIQYYTFDESMVADKKGTLTDSDEMLVLKLYYFFDTVGGNNGGDGIPDMYQKRVEFKVVNGRWPGTNQTIIVEYVTLTKDGNWDKDGTAKVEVPTNMIPFDGYENGGWDAELDEYVVVSGTDTVRYTYTFDKIPVVEPENPDVGGEGDGDIDGDGSLEGDTKFAVIFGKTNAIGWYNVSLDGGETYQIVQGNSTLEVDIGTEIIVKASNPFDGSFTFFVNGDILDPNENGEIRVVVDGALLIGAWSIEIEDESPEESLNWFQKIIKAIKDFFAKLFGWMK